MTTYTADDLARALAAAAEAFLSELENQPEAVPSVAPADVTWTPTEEPIEFDPLTDPLPIPADPDPTAPWQHQRMCSLAYLGSIARYYAETGKGATAPEIRRFAMKAGYINGRVVNGWNSRPGSRRGVENIDGERFINQFAAEWIASLQEELGVKIRGDIKWLPIDDNDKPNWMM